MLELCLAYLDDANDVFVFEDMYYTYRKQMTSYALTFFNNEADAEDVVEDVFLKIAQKYWDTVRKIENSVDLRNYLLKATKHTAINQINSSKKENVSLDTVLEYNLEGEKNLSDDSFLECICTKFDYEEVLGAINSLDGKYRDVLYYHFVLDMTVSETSKLLEQPLTTTKKQLVRGKKILMHLLDRKGDENIGNK